jgi:hypothetical protein
MRRRPMPPIAADKYHQGVPTDHWHKFHDPEIGRMAAVASSLRATMGYGTVTVVSGQIASVISSGGASSETITLTGVTNGDTLVVAAFIADQTSGTLSVSTTTGTTSAWSTINSVTNAVAPSQLSALATFYATTSGTGTQTVEVTIAWSGSAGHFGGVLVEVSNGVTGSAPGVPTGSTFTDYGKSAAVDYAAMAVAKANSLGIVFSITDEEAETNSTGLGTFEAGPLHSGAQWAGWTFGNASANISAATGWTINSGYWCTAGIVIPPAPYAPTSQRPSIVPQIRASAW